MPHMLLNAVEHLNLDLTEAKLDEGHGLAGVVDLHLLIVTISNLHDEGLELEVDGLVSCLETGLLLLLRLRSCLGIGCFGCFAPEVR